MKLTEFRVALKYGCDISPNAKAALTCLGCGYAGDFEGDPTVKEAMIQIDQFKQAHLACKETRDAR